MPVRKKKVIKSLDGLDETLKDLLKKQYPNGYESSVTRITNAKKEPIFVFPLETGDATYLIKLPSTKNSDGEYDVDFGKKGEFDDPDDIQEFRNDNEEGEGDVENNDNFDDDGGAPKDPSYDPDFDN